MSSSHHQIHDLRYLSPPSSSLLTQLRAGLSRSEWVGDEQEWKYRRNLPTMLLYDEEGLKLYEKITKDVPDYYLYNSELNLLAKHSDSIVSHLFPNNNDDQKEGKRDVPPARRPPVSRWRVGDWGGEDVGKWNEGVNGEEGLGDGTVQVRMEGGARGREKVEREEVEGGGCGVGGLEGVVLELGAGSLGKTSHLLKALASRPSTSLPVQYLALDLDKEELYRTLSDVERELGPQLSAGNVQTGGVWGTFDAGLDWTGKGEHVSAVLKAISPSSSTSSSSEDGEGERTRKASVSTASHSPEPVLPTTAFPPSPPSSTTSFSPLSSATDPDVGTTPTHYLFLGSSLGNFPRHLAPAFLRSIPLNPGSGDILVLGLDSRNPKEMVQRAYNDEGGVTKEWAENMWNGVEELVGWQGDKGGMKEGWKYEGRYNVKEGRHEAYFRSLRAQTITIPKSSEGPELIVAFDEGELLNIEWSYKYSPAEAQTLFSQSNFRPITSYIDPATNYTVWLLERPPFSFPPISAVHSQSSQLQPQQAVDDSSSPHPTSGSTLSPLKANSEQADSSDLVQQERESNPYGVPSVKEWEELWALWDGITLGMISKEMLLQKPIDLRHKNLFYIGHIPAFLDIFLSRHLNEPHSEPEYFKDLFERGIDPDVDDPTKVHSHSIVPESDDQWPCLELILTFRDRVRRRLLAIYDDIESGKRTLDRRLGRVLFMTHEHEAMHAETLLYMLLQSPHTLPPPGFARPSFSPSPRSITYSATPERILIPATTVVLGHHDLESEDVSAPGGSWEGSHEFGWDNEHSDGKAVEVKAFEVEWKGITNGEYKVWLEGEGKGRKIPGSWIEKDGEWKVKTLYGPLSFDQAGSWPLMASYDELVAYAQSKGGRLPTEPELRIWLDRYSSADPREGANVGLRNWVPVDAQPPQIDPSSGEVLQKGHNGGVWEWSSTPLEPLPGYVTSELYPGYSSDFFDECHLVVMGGSFATIPRIASRRSFRNFYQKPYPYAWVGARIVYDINQ